MSNVPFLELKTQYLSIKPDILAAVERVFDSTQFVLGKEVEAFEKEFAEFSGATFGVGMNSGTSALHLALLALGVGEGDEVITVPHTFVATVAAILYTQAKPVFVDIDPESYTLDPAQLEAAITPRTKAIMPVHLYGQPADMDPILEIAERHGIAVLEDAAQAHDAEYKGRRCGSLGHLAGFSFYPGKNLGAYGEGGMTTTRDAELNRKLRILRDWGQERKYHHEVLGFNARLEGVQGAVLRVKLPHLRDWTERRRSVAARYQLGLAELPHVKIPTVYEDRRHVFHLYVVLVEDRDHFMSYLGEHGVGCAIHYPFAIHLLPGYRHLGYREGEFPVSERVAAQCVSLPMYPEMTDEMVERVIEVVAAYRPAAVPASR
jgi:dTDP-4-amino-4,6-dideoxygalactose transaminase